MKKLWITRVKVFGKEVNSIDRKCKYCQEVK